MHRSVINGQLSLSRGYAEGCTDSPATAPAGLQRTQAQLQTSHRLAPTNSTRISDSYLRTNSSHKTCEEPEEVMNDRKGSSKKSNCLGKFVKICLDTLTLTDLKHKETMLVSFCEFLQASRCKQIALLLPAALLLPLSVALNKG